MTPRSIPRKCADVLENAAHPWYRLAPVAGCCGGAVGPFCVELLVSRLTAPLALRQTAHELSTAATRLVDVSRAMRQVRALATRAAAGDAKVFITGESGVGKDVVAQYIHAHSARATRPFVAVNCAAIADTLLETELFGHARGSFTGAYRDRIGRLEAAHRGTIFLDEIAEMSLQMQAHLLRFLESGEIQPVGSVGWADARRRPHHLGHQPRPRATRRDRCVSQRPPLPDQGRAHPRAPPARPQGRPADADRRGRQADGPADSLHRVGPAGAGALSLAGQRPRAAERDRTGRLDVGIGRTSTRRICPRPSGWPRPTT